MIFQNKEKDGLVSLKKSCLFESVNCDSKVSKSASLNSLNDLMIMLLLFQNQNWGQTTKGSGDSGLSSEDNSNPSGWRQGGQTDRHGQAERNGRNGPSAGRGNNHNNRPWLPQAQGQYRSDI